MMTDLHEMYRCVKSYKYTDSQTLSVMITLYEFLGFAALPD